MKTLLDIGRDLEALDRLIEEREGDITDPEVEATITAWFDDLADHEAVKLDRYAGLIASLEGESAVCRAEAARLQKAANSRESRVAWLKARMKAHLEATGRRSVKTSLGRTVSVQANGGDPPLLIDVPVEALPSRFQAIEFKTNRAAIKDALKAGESLDFARFGEPGTHLRIR